MWAYCALCFRGMYVVCITIRASVLCRLLVLSCWATWGVVCSVNGGVVGLGNERVYDTFRTKYPYKPFTWT